MANSFGTNVDSMREASDKILQTKDNIQQQLRALESQLLAEATTWKGGSAVSFVSLQERWNRNVVNLNNALEGIAHTIRKSGEKYQLADEHRTTEFSKITNVLG